MNRLQRFTYNSPQHVLWPIALAAFVAPVVLMTACSPLTQQTRTEAIAQQQASTGASQSAVDFVSKVAETPKPAPAVGTLSVSGENNKVEVTPAPPAPAETQDTRETRAGVDTRQKGGTSDSYSHVGEDSTSLTIIGYAVGLAALAVVVFFIIKAVKSGAFGAGVAAGFSAADDLLAQKIRDARSRLATAATEADRLREADYIAELEADRGRLAARQL